MNRPRSVRFLPLALAVPLAACATMGGLRDQPLTAGVPRVFPAPLDRTVEAARQAMSGAGIDLREQWHPSPDSWMLLGEKGMSLWSYGELVRVVAQRTDSAQTGVYVITQRRLATNIVAEEDWSVALFDRMAATLGASGFLAPDAAVTLLPGTSVRLTWRGQDRQAVGELRGKHGDTLVVYDPFGGREIRPLLGELASLETAHGRRTAARTGVLLGGVVGLAVGIAVGSGESYSEGGFVADSPILIGMACASIGMLAGGLVGSGMVTERWEPVPLDHLRVAPALRPAP